MPQSSTAVAAVLDLLRSDGPLTRAELLARTGMARSTLVEKVETLRRHGLVRDAEVRRGTGGRPATALAFDGAARVLLLVDLGASHVTAALTDLDLRLRRLHRLRLDTTAGPDAVLPTVIEAARALLDRHDAPLLGVGLGFPGPVAADRGPLGAQTLMRRWDGADPAGALRAALGVPVLLANDANAMAYGEYVASVRAGGSREDTLLVVKVSTGIGAGLIAAGALHRGAGGGAGELGHVRLAGATARCTCGARGCLGALASGRALLRRLRPGGARELADIAAAAGAGDDGTLRALREAGGQLGAVLAGVVTMVDPHAVLLGGEIGRLPAFVRAVRGPLLSSVPARIARRLRLQRTLLADESVITGLAALLVDAELRALR